VRRENPKKKNLGGIVFRCNDNGWMTEELMVKWRREAWVRRRRRRREECWF
jgi:hypothetical protein